jgi:hypothetical protein
MERVTGIEPALPASPLGNRIGWPARPWIVQVLSCPKTVSWSVTIVEGTFLRARASYPSDRIKIKEGALMIKRLVAAGVSTAGVAALALGTFVAPAHADVTCTKTVFHIWYVKGQPKDECTKGPKEVGMPNRAVAKVHAGNEAGYLVRRDNKKHVAFKKYQTIPFAKGGVNFTKIHFTN